jgi:hypothetical protein
MQFWNTWPTVYKRIFWFAASLFILTILLLWFFYFSAPAPALSWNSIQEQELHEIPAYTFQQGLFELTIHGDNYLIFERWLGGNIESHEILSYCFLGLLMVFMIIMTSIVTTLQRFWSLAGLGLFILFIVSFRMEVLSMFGLINKTFTVIVLVLYIPIAYYINVYSTNISFIKRIYIFSGITAIVGICIMLFAGVPKPFLHLAATGVSAGIVLTAIFILMVAPEIIAFFVFIVSTGSKQTKSLNHFLIVSVVYLVNLVLFFLSRANIVGWNFLSINLFLLLTISGIIGIWSFRDRRPQYENIIEADPFGVFFILSLGSVCFGTIAYFISQANDSVLESFNVLILYSHIGYGLIFVIYTLSNFISLLGNNLPTYKVLYKPTNMPYFTSRFAGLIATLAFVFTNTWQVPVYNAMGGYYNAVGDLYVSVKNYNLAEAFYEKASEYGFLNHHANYAIAGIEAGRNNNIKERIHYKRAGEVRPTEMSFLNYSQTYQREQNWLEALFILNDAAKIFPKSGTIKNTQGLVYAKLHLTDSALMRFNEARSFSSVKNSAELNLIALAAKENLTTQADSLYNLIGSSSQGVQANALAFANQQGRKLEMPAEVIKDTVVNLFSATLWNNYILNHLDAVDTTFVNRVIEIAKKPSNSDYSESLLFASALALYRDGQVNKAFELIQQVIIYSSNQGKYNNILALWALEQQAPETAVQYLAYALNQNFESALLSTAIAQSETHNIGLAVVAWDSVRRNGDSTHMKMAESMIRVLGLPSSMLSKLTEEEKYAYCRYRLSPADTIELKTVLSTIKNEDLKAKALLDASQKLYRQDETDAAIGIFRGIKGLKLSDKKMFEDIQHFELLMLAKKNDIRTLTSQINTGIEFNGQRKNEKIYFTALMNISSGDSVNAKKNFEWLHFANAYFDDAVVTSAWYFKANSSNNLKAYEILVEAILINPQSVKILKAYSLEAAKMGFDDYAKSGLERLSRLIPAPAFRKFMLDNQQTFSGLTF